MLLQILIIPVLLISIITILKLEQITKHDKVLFRFCQVRRDIMTMMREEGFSLSETDYACLRELLNILNSTIDNYERLKTGHFNLWRFMRYLKAFKHSADKIQRLEISGNPKMAELQTRSFGAILLSFFTYTPFIKSGMLLRIGIWILEHLAKSGIPQIKRFLNYLLYLEKLAERSKTHLSYS